MTKCLNHPSLCVLLTLVFGCSVPSADDQPVDVGMTEAALIVPISDATPPDQLLLAIQESGRPNSPTATVEVSSSSSPPPLVAASRTSQFGLIAYAADAQSGIQDLSIWCNKATTWCNPDTCTQSGPGLLAAPTFAASGPAAQPGTDTAAGSLMFELIDLKEWVQQTSVGPGTTRFTEITCWARARNNLGGETSTPSITIQQNETYTPPPISCEDECVSDCKRSCPSGRDYRGCLLECRVECADICLQ
jgi:hypothetical protein